MCKEGYAFYMNGLRTPCNSIKCHNEFCRKQYCEKEYNALKYIFDTNPPSHIAVLYVSISNNYITLAEYVNAFLEAKFNFLEKLKQFRKRFLKKWSEFEFYWNFELGEEKGKPHLNFFLRIDPNSPDSNFSNWVRKAWDSSINKAIANMNECAFTKVTFDPIDTNDGSSRYFTKCLRKHVPKQLPECWRNEKFKTHSSSLGFFGKARSIVNKIAQFLKMKRIRKSRAFRAGSFRHKTASFRWAGMDSHTYPQKSFLGILKRKGLGLITNLKILAYKVKKKALGLIQRLIQ